MRPVILRYLHFILIFIDTIKAELLNFILQSDIVRIWAHIKLSPFYYKANGLTNWHQQLVAIVYPSRVPNPTLATAYPLSVCQNV